MSYLLRNSDFAQTPLKNAVLDRRTTGPDHAVEGQVIFNTTKKEPQVFKEGAWVPIDNAAFLAIDTKVGAHSAEYANLTNLGHIKTDNFFKLKGSGVPTVSARKGNDLVFGNSTTPEADLVSIPNVSFYEGFVNNATGYPATHGSIFGFKSSSNYYGYSWQIFHGHTASIMYRRYSTGGAWSAWKAVQEV